MATSSPPATDAVLDPAILDGDPVFAAFAQHVAGLTRQAHASAGGLWGSSQALVLARLIERGDDASWLVVCSTEGEAELFLQDLGAFGHDATLLAAREGTSSVAGADLDSVRRRLQTTQKLAGPEERRPRVVVASLLSLLQPVPSPRELERDFLNLQVGQKIVAEDMLARLVHGGYTRQPLAESPGEISLRGDILDVFPFAADLPVRLELFDEELESLRTFDPETQRSVESLHGVSLCIASDAGGVEDGRGVQPLTLLPLDTHVVEVEPLRVEDQAKGLRVRSSAHARSWTQLRTDMDLRRRISLQSLPSQQHDLALRSVQSFSVGAREAGQLMARELGKGVRCIVPCLSEGERDRFRTVLGKIEGTDGIETPLGSIAKGFRPMEAGVVILNHRELVGLAAAESALNGMSRSRAEAT